MLYKRFALVILVTASLALGLSALWIGLSGQSEELFYQEKVVAGSADQFMEVHHVILKGSNRTIGKKIGEIALKDNFVLRPSSDRLKTRVQREYLSRIYPVYLERMRGVAEAFGKEINDDSYDFSSMLQSHIQLGCSAVFYPSSHTRNGHSILSRNFDFTTGTIQGTKPHDHERAALARPYIFEIYPDRGYPSLAVCAYELLGGVLDGINSEGLVVAAFAEEESAGTHPPEPSPHNEVGLHELLVLRYLLDTCKDTQEAKEVLLTLKQYYAFTPLHYIVADRHGKSFIFEFSPSRNRTHIIDGTAPQCITNHLISRYVSIDDLPDKDAPEGSHSSYRRYRVLSEAIMSKEKFGIEEIRKNLSRVAVAPYIPRHPLYAPLRTLWSSVYDADARTLEIDFYLGEEPIDTGGRPVKIDRSDVLRFQLEYEQ